MRHFNREFSKYRGTSPKEYLRIVRFQRLLHLLQNNPGTELTELAYGCWFCDESRLNIIELHR
ncbi:MAG: helix-turn-helix domain-containing protein [Bacteroides graminisolvens]|nr:helix-turn-helix domain-containing protein [Bacteroides graminisolvens]